MADINKDYLGDNRIIIVSEELKTGKSQVKTYGIFQSDLAYAYVKEIINRTSHKHLSMDTFILMGNFPLDMNLVYERNLLEINFAD